jgi:hypothetical protein
MAVIDSRGRSSAIAARDDRVGDVRPDRLHDAEALVADDQEAVALRGGAVLGGVDLFVRSVDAQDPHQHPAAAGHLVEGWLPRRPRGGSSRVARA